MVGSDWNIGVSPLIFCPSFSLPPTWPSLWSTPKSLASSAIALAAAAGQETDEVVHAQALKDH